VTVAQSSEVVGQPPNMARADTARREPAQDSLDRKIN
jgi:hypothetical protein